MVRFKGLSDDGLIHGVADRKGGVSPQPFASLNLSIKTGDEASRVWANRQRFERIMGVHGRRVLFGRLQHGDQVAVFKVGDVIPPLSQSDSQGWPTFEADAAVTNVPGLAIVMTFADCVPILLWDPDHQVCAMAHAGWRGTALRIASTTVRSMVDVFGTRPGNVRAAIGPSIGPCCYSVGDEVRAAFTEGFGRESRRFFLNSNLDLWAANRHDLGSTGITDGHIETSAACTSCQNDAFFSHRAEAGRTGRFGAFIGVR